MLNLFLKRIQNKLNMNISRIFLIVEFKLRMAKYQLNVRYFDVS